MGITNISKVASDFFITISYDIIADRKKHPGVSFFPILGITIISKVASDFFTTISYDIIADRKKHPGVSFSYIGYYKHIQGRLRLLHNNQLRYHCRQKETSWCKFFPILCITIISKVASDFFTTISYDIIADRKKHPGVSFSYIVYYNHIQGRLRLLHNNQLRYHCRQKETSWCKFFPILCITIISKVASDFFTIISYDIIADRKKHPGVSFSYIGYYKHIQGRLRLLHNNQLRYHCRQKETSWCKFFPILCITIISKVASDFFTTISYDIIADRKKHPGVSFSYIGYYNHIQGRLRLLHNNQLRYHCRQKETSWCKFFLYCVLQSYPRSPQTSSQQSVTISLQTERNILV